MRAEDNYEGTIYFVLFLIFVHLATGSVNTGLEKAMAKLLTACEEIC